MRRFAIIVILFSFSVNAQESVINDAQSSFLKGELFNALRFYSRALEQKIQLSRFDIANFITTKQILSSSQVFESFCKNPPEKSGPYFAFECGGQLIKAGKFEDALAVLNTVPESVENADLLVLKATASLNSSKKDQCLGYMERAFKLSKLSLTEQELKSISGARCMLMVSKYNEAIRAFHGINSKSPYYLSSLEEQAWTHFKRRDLESARELLSVLSAVYESQKKTLAIADDSYFKSRYLAGYIELLSGNTEKSKKILRQLSSDIEKYKGGFQISDNHIRTLFKQIREVDNVSKLQEKQFRLLSKIRNLVFSWDRLATLIQIDDGIRYVIAINKELKQIEKLKIASNLPNYKNSLMRLRQAVVQSVAQAAYHGVLSSQKTIESLLFKSNMGQLENVWAERTEGKRTLAEVIEDYKYGVMQVEDYLGKIE